MIPPSMDHRPANIGQVRDYVQTALCSKDNLSPGCFAISELPLEREGSLCAIYFCLHGPRQLRLTAIWDLQTGSLLCYGGDGERFHESRIAANGLPPAQQPTAA